MTKVLLRPAREDEAPALAAIAFAAKASHGHSIAQLEAWREALSPTPASIAACPTFVAEGADGRLAGFVQLDVSITPFELAHLWVRPADFGRGLGSALLDRALEEARARGAREVALDADPQAEGFYLARGARRVGARPAPIAGQPGRLLPRLVLALRPA